VYLCVLCGSENKQRLFPYTALTDFFYNSDLTLWSPVVTICTTSLTFSNSAFCPHSVFMCLVWIWEQTAIISVYSINWLFFITETESVYCAVRTEYLTKIWFHFFCKDLKESSLILNTFKTLLLKNLVSKFPINIFQVQIILCLICTTAKANHQNW